MSEAQALRPQSAVNNSVAALNERQLRIDLAAACRMAARLDWQEGVANHFSVATSADGREFLLNPLWRQFSGVRASDFVLLDSRADGASLPVRLDRTAWAIHGTMHAQLPAARCILHVHPPYATAWSCHADPRIEPIDQTCARFYQRIAIDDEYGGMADNTAEGLRLTRALGGMRVLMMRNHGVLVTGETVAEAFDALYHLERACRTLLLAHSSGQPLRLLSDEIAGRTALSWEEDESRAQAAAHFEQIKRMLDAEDPCYVQ